MQEWWPIVIELMDFQPDELGNLSRATYTYSFFVK